MKLRVEIISVADRDDDFQHIEDCLIDGISPFINKNTPNLSILSENKYAEVTLNKQETIVYSRELDYLLVDESSEDLAVAKIDTEEYDSLRSLILPQLRGEESLPLLIPVCDLQEHFHKVRALRNCDEGTVAVVRPCE